MPTFACPSNFSDFLPFSKPIRFFNFTRGAKCQPFQGVRIFGELGGRPTRMAGCHGAPSSLEYLICTAKRQGLCKSRCMHYDHGTSMTHACRLDDHTRATWSYPTWSIHGRTWHIQSTKIFAQHAITMLQIPPILKKSLSFHYIRAGRVLPFFVTATSLLSVYSLSLIFVRIRCNNRHILYIAFGTPDPPPATSSSMSRARHDTCIMIILHACTMIIVHAS